MNITTRFKKQSIVTLLSVLILLFIPILLLNTIIFTPIKMPVDTYYHLSRIASLMNNRLQFTSPQNFQTLGQFGIATNIFYPAQTIHLFLLFIPKVGVITTYKCIIYLNLVVMLLSSYVSLRLSGLKNNLLLIFFSIIFSLSVSITTGIGGIGESIAMCGIPWLSLGLWKTDGTKENFKTAVISTCVGLSFAAYSHLMTFLFLCIFTLTYSLVRLIQSKRIIPTLKVMFYEAFFSLLAILSVVYPVIKISSLNDIKQPVINLNQFETMLTPINNFFTPSNSVIAFAAILIIILISFYPRLLNAGVILGFTMALLGTDIFSWSQLLNRSFLVSMQIPARLVRPGLGIALMFIFIGFGQLNNRQSEKTTKFVAALTIGLTLMTTGNIRSRLFPSTNQSNGHFITMTAQQTNQSSYQTLGYDATKIGAVSNFTLGNPRFWYIMNYADYIPKAALSQGADKSMWLGNTKKEKSLVNHQLLNTFGKIIDTRNFQAYQRSISFQTEAPLHSGTYLLPVLGYRGLINKVVINGKTESYSIHSGRVSVYVKKALKKHSSIIVSQAQPIDFLISKVISSITIVFLLLWGCIGYVKNFKNLKKH